MPTTYNKIELDGTTLLDLSQDTVSSASHIRQGYTGHLNDGTQVTGTYSGGSPTIQSLSVAPSTSQQSFNSSSVDGYKPVTVSAVSQTNLTADNIKSGTTVTISNGTSNLWSVTGTYSGGGGIGTLLATSATGSVNTTSTQAANLNKDVSVSGINAYDLLIVEASVDSVTNGRHCATISLIFLTAGTTIGTKNGGTVASNKLNIKVSSNGTYTSAQGTTAYGIYANSITISSGNATIPMYRRYNSTSTGTINGTYTTRVYGVKLYDLIGG